MLLLIPDNDPDEVLRSPSTQNEIRLFLKLEQVALIFISLPAAYSLFSSCERRMAPLSKQLITVVVDYQHYESHLNLNSSKITVDLELERKNFSSAVNRLADLLWCVRGTTPLQITWSLLKIKATQTGQHEIKTRKWHNSGFVIIVHFQSTVCILSVTITKIITTIVRHN